MQKQALRTTSSRTLEVLEKTVSFGRREEGPISPSVVNGRVVHQRPPDRGARTNLQPATSYRL